MKQTKKSKAKERKENSIQDDIRHLGVIIERIDDKVSLVAEQYGDIKETLDSHTEMIGSMKMVLDSHTEMIGSMKMDIEIIKTDVAFIKGDLKKKVDIEEFSALERRVALLEKRR